jgi:ribosomal protein L35
MKLSSKGTITRRKANEAHLRGKMTAKRRRQLSQDQPMAKADYPEALRLLGKR